MRFFSSKTNKSYRIDRYCLAVVCFLASFRLGETGQNGSEPLCFTALCGMTCQNICSIGFLWRGSITAVFVSSCMCQYQYLLRIVKTVSEIVLRGCAKSSYPKMAVYSYCKKGL